MPHLRINSNPGDKGVEEGSEGDTFMVKDFQNKRHTSWTASKGDSIEIGKLSL